MEKVLSFLVSNGYAIKGVTIIELDAPTNIATMRGTPIGNTGVEPKTPRKAAVGNTGVEPKK